MTKVKWMLFVCLIAIIGSCKFADQSSTVTVWITSGDQSRLFGVKMSLKKRGIRT
jgi:hypothetical protein